MTRRLLTLLSALLLSACQVLTPAGLSVNKNTHTYSTDVLQSASYRDTRDLPRHVTVVVPLVTGSRAGTR